MERDVLHLLEMTTRPLEPVVIHDTGWTDGPGTKRRDFLLDGLPRAGNVQYLAQKIFSEDYYPGTGTLRHRLHGAFIIFEVEVSDV